MRLPVLNLNPSKKTNPLYQKTRNKNWGEKIAGKRFGVNKLYCRKGMGNGK